MPGSSHQRPDGKINISLLFRPSVIRGPCPISTCREGGGQIIPPRFSFLPTSLTGRLAKRSLSSSPFFSREPSSLQLLLCDDASRQHHGPRPLHSAANHFFSLQSLAFQGYRWFYAVKSMFIIPRSLFAPRSIWKYEFQGPLCYASYTRGILSQNI